MNRDSLLFLGISLAQAVGWCGFVLIPVLQLNGLRQTETIASGETYPAPRPSMARLGAEVYRASGCVYCHSQQVRPWGADLERWGTRRTVANDYLFDNPVQLGRHRIGPDLTNIGVRPRSEEWHRLHLYEPRSVVQDSTMPPYPYLFERRKVARQPSADALKLSGKFVPPSGWETVPKPEARALIAYLLSLHSEANMFEAPPASSLYRPETNNQADSQTQLRAR